ncbi:interference hedgehog-like [Uloborus diversus]|uniref:interference hedgehog-like n=1 Tax=Uloborus diversus TaxID=327109 RepID=UPI00240927B6|nr:interference hedgehog-like [Uloborus diversus]
MYYCDADNSVGSMITASAAIEVQETPQIVKISKSVFVEAGNNVTLNCATRGHPKPSLTWIHNGQTLHTHPKIKIKGSHLTLENVTRKESGIYQCFANNELGTVYGTTNVSVFSKNRTNMDHDSSDLDYDSDEDFRKPPNDRKKDAIKLIPPSRPDISRLSNTSVMVRWSVPRNDGLPVVFFKIQYKEVGITNAEWMTVDEDIAAHIHSYAVTGLLSGVKYRFRVAAVYSNNDNKSGPISSPFMLSKEPLMEKPSSGPTIVFAEPESPSAITLKWKYEDVDSVSIEGFFIHYRASHTAGKYLKVTVLGANTRSHTISHLLPDTGYDVKMQCFNIAGTSEFSNIITAKTKVAEIVPGIRNRNGKIHHEDDMAISLTDHEPSKSSDDSFILYIVLGIIAGALFITSIVYAFLFFRQKRSRTNCDNRNDEEDDPLKLGNGHISGNGYIAVGNKINISVNPLSQINLDNGEKIEDLEDIVSNNNEIIRLQTFSVNVEPESEPLTNGAGVNESNFNGEEKSAVILSGNFGSSTSLPENTE